MVTPGLPRPAVRPPRPWTFPTPEVRTLGNGLRVAVFSRPGQYVVTAGLALDLPLTSELSAVEGVAGLTARVLDEGTAAHPGPSFAEAVEDCGAVLSAEVGYSHVGVYVDVPGSHLAEALRLLVEALSAPTLTDADVERHRTLRVAQIEQQLANSAERANHALRRALIEARFRSSRMKSGEPGTVAAVTPADVREYHARWYGPQGATLVVAGDFDAADLDAALADLEGWANPGQESAPHERPAPRPGAAWLLDRPGSVQADIRLGWFGIDRRDPRWADLQIAANALGGAYLSRLNRVLREERGFTYGASLLNVPLRDGGYTYASGSFRNEVVGEALALMPGLVDVAAEPITVDEATRARDYLVGTSPLRYATAGGLCTGVMSLLGAGLTWDFVNEGLDAYRRVTPGTATDVARDILRPDAGTLVVVGDAGALEGPIRAAGWAPQVVGAGEEIGLSGPSR